MLEIDISNNNNAQVQHLLSTYQLPPKLEFGTSFLPIMAVCDYKDGKWHDLQIVPYDDLRLDPSAKVLHYGQEIFEGMKVLPRLSANPCVFRLFDHHKRFNLSAQRLMMPTIPEKVYQNGINQLVELVKDFIPQTSGTFLYLRPFMFGTEAQLGVKPSANYKFIITASPCQPLASADGVNLYIEREYTRAAPGGIGSAKTGGNYAASLVSLQRAYAKGCQQVLWLDAFTKTWVEECSGSNFFAVINGKLCTPPISDTILDGITRRSIIALARRENIEVQEIPISINEMLHKITTKSCTEAFISGTAVILSPVRSFCDANGQQFLLEDSQDSISKKLRKTLLAIQEGKDTDHFSWNIECNPVVHPKETHERTHEINRYPSVFEHHPYLGG